MGDNVQLQLIQGIEDVRIRCSKRCNFWKGVRSVFIEILEEFQCFFEAAVRSMAPDGIEEVFQLMLWDIMR